MNASVRPEVSVNSQAHSVGDNLGKVLLDRMVEPFAQNEGEQEREIDNQLEERREEGEEISQEGIRPIVGKELTLPSKEEIRAHMVNHIPFRSWCEHCFKGECRGNRHLRKKDVEFEDREPIVSVDDLFMHDNQQEG